jgi:hypothetical protein
VAISICIDFFFIAYKKAVKEIKNINLSFAGNRCPGQSSSEDED